MRLFIAGQKAFGAAVFALARKAGHEIAGVSSPASARGAEMDRLRWAAAEARVPWMLAGTLCAETLPPGVDLILAAHSHDFVGRRTRLQTRLGAVGYHPSLLPLHRGRDAVKWAIRMGDRVTGGSIYWLSDTMDGGDIAARDFCFIRREDTAAELWRRELFPLGLRLFARVLEDLSRGYLIAVPQDDALATWEPALDAPPVRRPDLPMLGTGGLDGFTVIRELA